MQRDTMMRVKDVGFDLLRMAQWIALAGALYFITFDFGLQDSHPGLQSTIYTLAQITIRAWLGYWIARTALGRVPIDGTASPVSLLSRAVLIGCVVLTSR